MTNTNIDEHIRTALKAEDRELFDQLDSDMGPLEMVAETFRGKMRWIVMLCVIFTIALMGVGIWCLIRFFAATDVKELIVWAGGFGSSCLIVMMVKVWFWMEMQKISILREVKRVELAVAQLNRH